MSFVIYHKETTRTVNDSITLFTKVTHQFNTEQGAKSTLTRLVNQGKIKREDFAIADYKTFLQSIEKNETKINLMSGKPFNQPVNTPLYCDPSSETYWSM